MPLRGGTDRNLACLHKVTHTSSMKTSAIFSGLEGKVYTKINKVLVLSIASIFSVHLSGQEV